MDEQRQDELRRRRERARAGSGRRTRVLVAAAAVAVVVLGGAAVGAALQRAATEPQAATTTPRGSEPSGSHVAAATRAATTTTTPVDPRSPEAWTRAGVAARNMRVPILMYHLIADAPAGAAYPGLWVPPEELQAQVSALKRAGFVAVTLGEVWDAWHGDGRLPAHPVVLSFDDGDISQVLGGAPVLSDAGWPGVLNLATNHLGKGGLPMWGARRLIKQGWEVDSHTVHHADMTALSGEALTRELVESRQEIKAKLGVTPRFFCYPAGRNDAASRRAVKQAGYVAATTTEPGMSSATDDPFGLPRVRIDPGTSGAAVVALAQGRATPAGGAEH